MDSEDLFGGMGNPVVPEVIPMEEPERKKVKMKLKKWPAQTMERIAKFLEEEKYCDVVLRFPQGGERIAVHSLLLFASCDFFSYENIGEF